ncbi:MAG: chorismate mutase [Eubacteriales bacterium]|nr:chorismate mutase [Eubacteriales bacterium]
MEKDRLLELRRQLEEIDKDILGLVEGRMERIREMGEYKRGKGLEIYDPAREREMFELYTQRVKDPRNLDCVQAVMLSLLRASKREQRRGLNVYFVGMPGSGKSKLAMKVGRLIGKNVLDTDEMVKAEAGMSIAELFFERGEAEFRRLEAQMLKRAAARGYSIVATGGGILTHGGNLETMAGSGRVVFLDKSLEELYKQDISGRPLLARGRADIEKLYYERRDAYLEAADFTVDPDTPDALQLLIDYCGE